MPCTPPMAPVPPVRWQQPDRLRRPGLPGTLGRLAGRQIKQVIANPKRIEADILGKLRHLPELHSSGRLVPPQEAASRFFRRRLVVMVICSLPGSGRRLGAVAYRRHRCDWRQPIAAATIRRAGTVCCYLKPVNVDVHTLRFWIHPSMSYSTPAIRSLFYRTRRRSFLPGGFDCATYNSPARRLPDRAGLAKPDSPMS